jgi:hypothetical protein
MLVFRHPLEGTHFAAGRHYPQFTECGRVQNLSALFRRDVKEVSGMPLVSNPHWEARIVVSARSSLSFRLHHAGCCERVHSNATRTESIVVVLHEVSPCLVPGGCSVQRFL